MFGLKPFEIVGVTAVGLGLSIVGTKLRAGALSLGTLLYVIGVMVGAKRPSSGWFGRAR
jgi:hypothetical protein